LDIESSDSPGVRLVKIDADSPASRAGLNAEDRILEFAGREVKKYEDLIGAVMTAESPAKAIVKSPKDEKSREIEVDLPGRALRLGVTWRVDEAEPKSLILAHVVPGTPAALAGLQPGDRVYQIAGHDFADENEFIRLASEATDSLDLLTERNGKIQLIHVNLKSAAPLKQAA
jgi:S1-C subfamily serine protease